MNISQNMKFMVNNNLLSEPEIQRYMELLEKIESVNKLDPSQYMVQIKM